MTPNFTVTESLSNNALLTFLDTSTSITPGLTERRIYLRLANGNWLTTAGQSTTSAYEVWDINDTSIILNLLTRSTVAYVKVDWMTNSTITETKTILNEWNLYDYLFLFGLLSNQTSAPARTDSIGYWPNSWKMCTNLFQSEQAVILMDDIYSSSAALDRNQFFIDNESNFF